MGELEYNLLIELARAVHDLAPPDRQRRIAEAVRQLEYFNRLQDFADETSPPATDV